MPNRKMLMIIGGIILLILVVGGGVLAWNKFKTKPADTTQSDSKKRKVSEPTNVLPLDQRPYIQIAPTADGKNVTLIVQSLKKAAEKVEYELEYQAGSLLQGAFGELELGSLPTEKQLLLGSCSAGGACTYHTDIKGGTLLLRFQGAENYALKSEWRYFDNQAKETAVSSKDAKFQLEAPNLKNQRYAIVYNSPGYPEGLTGTPVSDPYSLISSGTLKGKGKLTMRAAEEGQLTIVGWDGSQWQEFETTVEGKSATADVDLLELYVVVK